MATETFYERRMKALQDTKVANAQSSINPLLQRPANSQPNVMASEPATNTDTENQIDSSSPFLMHVESFKQQDPHFDQMMQGYTQLALGLRSSVQQGLMPEAIAQQKLQDYINDNREATRSRLSQQAEKEKATSQLGTLGQALMEMQQGGQNGSE